MPESDPFERNDDGEFECDCGEIYDTLEQIRGHARNVHDKGV